MFQGCCFGTRLTFITFPGVSVVKNPPAIQETQAGNRGSMPMLGRSPGKNEMATHSSTLAWIISTHGSQKSHLFIYLMLTFINKSVDLE